jgi:hypothetical protein
MTAKLGDFSLTNVRLLREHDTQGRSCVRWSPMVGWLENLTIDAHLAALAIGHAAALMSCDGDFGRFKGLRWENPLNR